MDCDRPQLNRWCYALLLAGAVAWPAAAQESMVFSKPANLSTEKANDFLGDQHRNLGSLGTPSPLFGKKPKADFDVLPGATRPRPLSLQEIKFYQKSLDDQKNWMFQTPAEILGIPSPEKILGLPDPNHEENLSNSERWMNRQQREHSQSATNGLRLASQAWASEDNPFLPQNPDDRQAGRDDRISAAKLDLFGRPMNGSSSLRPGTDPKADQESLWHSAFNTMPAPPKPDLEQVALMERFKGMMDYAPPEKPAPLPGYAPAPVEKRDPYLQAMPASFNPAGRSYTPMDTPASRPMGINPLPTITGKLPGQTPAKAQPLVETPPWLRHDLKPGERPHPQF